MIRGGLPVAGEPEIHGHHQPRALEGLFEKISRLIEPRVENRECSGDGLMDWADHRRP